MEPSARPVFLIGFMACGKTTVGRLLAGELGYGFVDTDDLVERREGRSVERVFADSGEGQFRRAEWEILKGLDGLDRTVVATGGGTFLGYAQRRWMIDRGRTVWLDVPLDIARSRTAAEGPGARVRPLWRGNDPIGLRALFEKRRAAYALAEIRADASAPAAEIARALASTLRAR